MVDLPRHGSIVQLYALRILFLSDKLGAKYVVATLFAVYYKFVHDSGGLTRKTLIYAYIYAAAEAD